VTLLLVVYHLLAALAAPPTLYSVSLTVDNVKYDCEEAVNYHAVFSTCQNGSAYTVAKYNLKTTHKADKWKQYCGFLCVEATVSGGKNCVGFSQTDPDYCELVFCPEKVGINKPTIVKAEKGAPTKYAVVMEPDCFLSAPSQTPSTPPAESPTTSAPVASCTVTGEYASDFASLNGFAPHMEAFVQIMPDYDLCEYVELQGATYETVDGFTCDLDSCVRWCYYNTNCNFAMYNPVEEQCIRANTMTLTDNSEYFQPYYTDKIVVYSRLQPLDGSSFPEPYGIPYFSSLCADLPTNQCPKNPECGWDKGKRGYNAPTLGGSTGGWCGRIKCFAATGYPGKGKGKGKGKDKGKGKEGGKKKKHHG